MRRLEGKPTLMTGSARGIGKTSARANVGEGVAGAIAGTNPASSTVDTGQAWTPSSPPQKADNAAKRRNPPVQACPSDV